MADIDFETLKTTRRPNKFLLAPVGMCQNAKTDMDSNIYATPVQKLHDAFLAVARRQPRTTIVAQRADGVQLIQKSRFFRFPDLIDVAFFHIDDGHSTLAIYSRAKLGYRDFGVNQLRVRTWIDQLDADLI